MNPLDQGVVLQLEIPLADERLEKCVGGAATPGTSLRELCVRHAFLADIVVVRIERIAARASGLDESGGDRMRPLDGADVKRSVVSARGSRLIARFDLAQNRHCLLRRPAVLVRAAERFSPAIEVACRATHVDRAVDAAAAAKHAASPPTLDQAMTCRIRLSAIAPVMVQAGLKGPGLQAYVRRPIRATCFEDQYPGPACVGHQLMRQCTAGGAGADDDVVPLDVRPFNMRRLHLLNDRSKRQVQPPAWRVWNVVSGIRYSSPRTEWSVNATGEGDGQQGRRW
jgi:hypothetical protein